MILFVTDGDPMCPASDQHPSAERMTWLSASSGKTWTIDYLGSQPSPEEVRLFVEPTQAESDAAKAAADKASADTFATSNNPASRASRAMARVTMESVHRVIDKVNECVSFCNSKGASITPLQKSTFAQLLQAVKAKNANETDPTM